MAEHPKHINPSYRKQNTVAYSLQECIDGIENDRQILSYLISKAESPHQVDEDFILELLNKTHPQKKVRRLAISGSPGVGKSTFINSYGSYLITKGQQVAILPVDPTSQISKGSILGDKTRMDQLIGKEQAYIKPMASSLALGGVAPSTNAAIMLCERAGFDYIIIETVGVGQSEYVVRHLVDCFVLLLQPGGGDDLQGIKRGIMEMADILVVNKADGHLLKSAEESLKSYRNSLMLMLENNYEWKAKAISYSSLSDSKVDSMEKLLDNYFEHMSAKSRLEQLRNAQSIRYYDEISNKLLVQSIERKTGIRKLSDELRAKIELGNIFPVMALKELKEKLENELF